MCTALFLYDTHPTLLLLLLFNRDEFYDRHALTFGICGLQLCNQNIITSAVPQGNKRGALLGGQARHPGWERLARRGDMAGNNAVGEVCIPDELQRGELSR